MEQAVGGVDSYIDGPFCSLVVDEQHTRRVLDRPSFRHAYRHFQGAWVSERVGRNDRGFETWLLRFPGGCYVEGVRLINAFRWRDSIGLYNNRPSHFGDVWNYWTDDGFGYYEGLQLAEDLGAAPIWVFNIGISHQESVATEVIGPWVEDVLDGLEFARGPTNSTWGAVCARMGHPDPFPLHHVAIGNEDCWKPYYRGNYMEFYKAIKLMYPDVQIISNCDGSGGPLDHPADLYDYHIYTNAYNLFSMRHAFDQTSRNGPKAVCWQPWRKAPSLLA